LLRRQCEPDPPGSGFLLEQCKVSEVVEATLGFVRAGVMGKVGSMCLCCRFGGQAKSRDLVMNACGRYWNATLGLSSDSLERELLKEPLTELIDLSTAMVRNECTFSHEGQYSIAEDPAVYYINLGVGSV